MTSESLSNPEKRALLALAEVAEPCAAQRLLETEIGQFRDHQEAMGALSWLQVKGLVSVTENTEQSIRLSEAGRAEAAEGLPEGRIMTRMSDLDPPSVEIGQLADVIGKDLVGPTIGHLKKLGAIIGAGKLVFSDGSALEVAVKTVEKREQFITKISDWQEVSQLDAALVEHFSARKGMLERKERVERSWSLSARGEDVSAGGLELAAEIGQLSVGLLTDGSWRGANFRPYDITTHARAPAGGRRHPMIRMFHRIRDIFLEMGFTEIEGNFAQSCFWNMDALFIPQDHPAREMQDTFYLAEPETISDASGPALEQVKAMHEHGGETRSKGWEYTWSEAEARRAILRTHTTVNTIRYLSEHQTPPIKVFGIGKVFRKESIDSTHLPEFTQVEGILIEEKANFNMLIGVLKEFYSKMGFPQLRVRPAYFPYTEPSLEIEVMFNGRWLELGGAGVFRPEVLAPFGVEHPVLAWGLGLERLALLTLGLEDIRDLYLSDIGWLKSTPL